jgi:hypothetical protein
MNGASKQHIEGGALNKTVWQNMTLRPTQFDVRENTASSRQHAPRLARLVSPSTNPQPRAPGTPSAVGAARPPHAALDNAATAKERVGTEDSPLTVREAAKFLGLSPQTVYLWVERKQVPISA